MFLGNFSRAISIMFKDKTILCLSSVPIVLGLVLYYLMGAKLYQLIMVQGQGKIKGLIGEGSGANLAYIILFVVFMAILFFVVNWTFVMVVSILAAPFNDAISTLVEKKYTALNIADEHFSWRKIFPNILKTIWNELKKVSLIMFLTLIAAALSFFPVIAPLGFLFSALLLAIQFIDYSWARHHWKAGQCIKDTTKHVFSYTFGGACFMLLMAVPIINLLALTVAIIYFTLLWADKNRDRITP